MNRVYKVIWSKAKHCYVVTSEIARSVTKSASSARSAGRKGAAVLAMAALLFTAGGMLGEAANVTDVTAGETANVITVTKEGSSPASITINNVAHAKEADSATEATKAYSDGDGLVIKNTYVKIADAKVGDEVTYVNAANTVGQNLSALDTQVKANADAVAAEATARKAADQNNLKVGDDGVISKVTGDGTTSSDVDKLVLNKDGTNWITMDEKGIKVGKNSTTMDEKGFYAGSDYNYGTAQAALDATEGKIRGANGAFEVNKDGEIKGAAGKFTVDKNGLVTANGGIDTNGGAILTRNGNINAGSGDISGKDISASGNLRADGDIHGKDITGSGTLTGHALTDGTARMEGGALTGVTTITATGNISTGGDVVSTGGKVQGTSVSDGTATLSGGSLTGAVNIAASGTITGNNVDVKDKLTTKNLEVTGDLTTDHITLGSKPLNYTDIDKGKVTSEVQESVGAVEYTAESIFNKEGSSITARTDEGAVDSTGKSKVGANEISQYLGDNAKPESSQKNVTRKMVRNDDGTFSMEDKAVDGGKSSTVSQNAGERKAELKEGTKTLTVTENLKDGIVSETKGDDGTVTLTQGMNGTYKVETSGTSTEEIGGQKIENYKGGLKTEITGDESHYVTHNQTITVDGTLTETVKGDVTEKYEKNLTTTVTGDSSLSAADIENKASSSIWNHVGEGYNTSWKMTDGKISESIVNGTASNKENTTAEGTKRIITNDKGTGTYNQTATSNNISLKNAAGDTSFTKSESLDGEKTSVTNPNGSSTINQSAESIVNFVKNSEGTTKTEQSAKDITNTAKNGTITNDAKDVLNKGANSVINEVGANQVAVMTDSVKAAYGSDTYTTWDDKGITSNTSGNMSNIVGGKMLNDVTGDMENKVGGNLTNTVTGDSSLTAKNIHNKANEALTNDATTITNTAQTVKTITGNNTVTSNTDGTTFENTGANTPVEDGNERGSRTNTKIKGNTVETGKVMTDFADVNNNLTVGGSTTLGRDGGNTNLTVNSKSEFKDTVKMDKTLEVDGESTFNNKVTITKNGLDVKGGTTTDTLTVTGDSEFVGRADFRDNVFMDKDLKVTGETRTGTLYVNNDGYVDGNLYVEGNIETHDAELSENSRQVVTGRQLYRTNERVDKLDNRIKKVGANAAALAALRPGDFNPDDKFSIAAGFGSYRNASAAALGLFYRPNENVLLSLGTSFGDGENMVNAGVSVKFGRGKSMAERRKEMAEEVSVMRDEMRSQDERIAELEEMLKKQSELIEKLSKES